MFEDDHFTESPMSTADKRGCHWVTKMLMGSDNAMPNPSDPEWWAKIVYWMVGLGLVTSRVDRSSV